jgi:hypothetical protein
MSFLWTGRKLQSHKRNTMLYRSMLSPFMLLSLRRNIRGHRYCGVTYTSVLKTSVLIILKRTTMLLQVQTDLPLCFLLVSMNFFFSHGATALVGQDHLIIEDSWLHSDTPHSAQFLWTNDRPDTKTSTWQHNTLAWNRHLCTPAGFEPVIPTSGRPQTHALDRASTGIGVCRNTWARCSFVECFNHPVRVFFCKWHRLELACYIHRSFVQKKKEEWFYSEEISSSFTDTLVNSIVPCSC